MGRIARGRAAVSDVSSQRAVRLLRLSTSAPVPCRTPWFRGAAGGYKFYTGAREAGGVRHRLRRACALLNPSVRKTCAGLFYHGNAAFEA